MALTRGNTEHLVIARVGPLMTAAGMDGTTNTGSNQDLNGPIGRAVRDLGYTVPSVTAVTDADIASVADADHNEFLDYAALHTLEAILGNLDDVDLRVGPRSEKFSQLAEQVERKIKRLDERCARAYGYGLATPSASVITMDFAEHE